jgi:uncharacterized protein YndB with AHSA1/START domain
VRPRPSSGGVTPRATDEIEHAVTIAASPEIVFSYFTDPAKLVQWMGAEATVDPRPGGVFRLVFEPTPEVAAFIAEAAGSRDEIVTNAVLGEFVEVDPYERIVFTWGYERELFATPPRSTTVEVSLTPVGKSTQLRLVHRRLPGASVGFHRTGWDHYLPRLAAAASGADPGPDPFSRTG